MIVEKITEHDLGSLAELYRQLIPHAPDLSKMQAAFQRINENPNAIILGAKENGCLVGSAVGAICEILFGKCKPFMVVEDVVIDSAHRRKGIGGALMRELENYASQHDCAYIILLTDCDRPEAQHFYESLGYKTNPYKGYKKNLSSNV
jgi:ribosomal protein S18 acetylase RimI-like enzyme